MPWGEGKYTSSEIVLLKSACREQGVSQVWGGWSVQMLLCASNASNGACGRLHADF